MERVGGRPKRTLLVKGCNFSHTCLPMGDDSLELQHTRTTFVRPHLFTQWEGFVGGTSHTAFGIRGQGRHAAILEDQSPQLMSQKHWWGGILGTPTSPGQHACSQEAITFTPHNSKSKPLSFPASQILPPPHHQLRLTPRNKGSPAASRLRFPEPLLRGSTQKVE